MRRNSDRGNLTTGQKRGSDLDDSFDKEDYDVRDDIEDDDDRGQY